MVEKSALVSGNRPPGKAGAAWSGTLLCRVQLPAPMDGEARPRRCPVSKRQSSAPASKAKTAAAQAREWFTPQFDTENPGRSQSETTIQVGRALRASRFEQLTGGDGSLGELALHAQTIFGGGPDQMRSGCGPPQPSGLKRRFLGSSPMATLVCFANLRSRLEQGMIAGPHRSPPFLAPPRKSRRPYGSNPGVSDNNTFPTIRFRVAGPQGRGIVWVE